MILKLIDFLKTIWIWIFSALFLIAFFVIKGHSFSQVFYFITLLLPVVIGTSYYVNNSLIPDYLLRKKYGLFIVYGLYTIIISLYLQYIIIFLGLLVFTTFQLNNTSILTLDIGKLSLILYLVILVNLIIEIIQSLNQKNILIQSMEESVEKKSIEPEYITVRYNRLNHTIKLRDIQYIESLSDYIKIVTKDDEIITKERISKIIERLPNYFIRTHRSFIVNVQGVSSYNREFISLGENQIPISRTYKMDVMDFLSEYL